MGEAAQRDSAKIYAGKPCLLLLRHLNKVQNHEFGNTNTLNTII